MTKEQVNTIPEELYNLTQLAEVTLAAGRLSTTTITKVRDFITHCEDEDNEPDTASNPTPKSKPMVVQNASFAKRSIWSPMMGDSQSKSRTDVSPSKPKNGGSHYRPMAKSAFYFSSDDDSNYYSHKVFDRKKLRRSTISDNSRYEEHSSCSSVPSCSGDDPYYGVASPHDANSDSTMLQASGLDSTSMSLLLGDEHICPECGKKYSTSSNLARHRQTHRSIMDKKARRCPYCDKVYVSMPAFAMHVRTHNQGCECPYCSKCFSRPWLLQGHIRTHTGEKPFKCDVCNKAFADKSNLRAHTQTHSNTKPYTCSRCGKAFALKSYLYKHEESSCIKKHQSGEAEPPRASNNGSVSKATTTAATPANPTTNTPNNVESAKITLASKLLQREKECKAIIAVKQPVAAKEAPTKCSLEITVAAAAVDTVHIYPKSPQYAALTANTVTDQKEYDHFKGIEIVQPAATAPAYAAIYHDQGMTATPMPTHMPPPFFVTKSESAAQDQPVDFSPKSSFAQPAANNAYKLTENYAILA